MLDVLFFDSAAAALHQALGRRKPIGRTIGIFATGGAISPLEAKQFQQKSDAHQQDCWENAVPLDGDPRGIVCLPLALSVGNIAESGIGTGREAAVSMLAGVFHNSDTSLLKARNSYARLLERMQQHEPIRIWASQQPDEMCGAYWLMEQLRPIGLENLEITLVKLPEWHQDPAGNIVQYTSWGEVPPHCFGRLAQNGRKLPTVYLLNMAAHWQALQSENAPLRAVINGRLVSVPESLYDSFILRELEAQTDVFVEGQLIAQVMAKYQLGISDAWIAIRMEQFIQGGLLTPESPPQPDEPIYSRTLRKR